MSAEADWAVVTGGVSGIGLGIALALARSGWNVALTYLEEDNKPARVTREIEALGGRAYVRRSDAGIAPDVDAFFDGAAAFFGCAPRLLVNNAGMQTWSPLLDLDEGDWDRVLRTSSTIRRRRPALISSPAARRWSWVRMAFESTALHPARSMSNVRGRNHRATVIPGRALRRCGASAPRRTSPTPCCSSVASRRRSSPDRRWASMAAFLLGRTGHTERRAR